jgi:hypothetical protein
VRHRGGAEGFGIGIQHLQYFLTLFWLEIEIDDKVSSWLGAVAA